MNETLVPARYRVCRHVGKLYFALVEVHLILSLGFLAGALKLCSLSWPKLHALIQDNFLKPYWAAGFLILLSDVLGIKFTAWSRQPYDEGHIPKSLIRCS